MTITRRKLLATLVAKVGAVGILVTAANSARACMWGTWKVRCPNGHDDIVTQGTCNHRCEKCGAQAFAAGAGYIVCPKGHANLVQTGTSRNQNEVLQSYKCPT